MIRVVSGIDSPKYWNRVTLSHSDPNSEVTCLDSTDRHIVQELVTNCRVTYQELGTKLGMTANAAKSRVQRLLDEGVIEEFHAILSLDAIEAEPLIALVIVDKVNDEEKLIQQLGSSPMIDSVRLDSLGGWVLHGEYIRSKGLAELSSFL